MNKHCCGILFLFGVFLSGMQLQAKLDSAAQEYAVYKAFPQEEIKELQKNEAYLYPLSKGSTGLTPWQKFKRWLSEFFTFNLNPSWWEYILYIACFVILLLVILKLLGIPISGLFKRPETAQRLPHQISEENLDSISFPQEIEQALDNGNYRLVIRLQYLYALYLLAKKELIAVRLGKTNYEYLYELQQADQRAHFAKMARLFDYVWYGDFNAEEQHIHQSADHLKALQNSLNGYG